MTSYFADNQDLKYYFERGIEWEPIVTLAENGFRQSDGFATLDEALEAYRSALELVGEFSATRIAPRVQEIAHAPIRLERGEVVFPPALDAIFAEVRELGLAGMCLPRELGGMNLPMLLHYATGEMFARADASVMSHHGFHGGIALAMLFLSTMEGTTQYDRDSGRLVRTRFEAQIREIAAGRAWGSMDMTEPGAGSDLGAITTRAAQDASGAWHVTGEKIFITSGHGKYHFVLARSEPQGGLAGLSLFLVPAWEQENGRRVRRVTLERLESKLGHHASATVALGFERAPAELVGVRGEGFRQMLLLMNSGRLSVAFESLGVCEAAYRLARGHAASRVTMGRTLERHELIADRLDEMRSDIEGIRALAVAGAWHHELAHRSRLAEHHLARDAGEARRLGATSKLHQRAARQLTPLAKYLGAEKAVEITRHAIQLHGGSGYMREQGVEKLLRDSVLMPIYEGTSQIQALMATKDALGAAPWTLARRLARARWQEVSARDPLARRVAYIESLSLGAQQHLQRRVTGDRLRRVANRPVAQWLVAFCAGPDPRHDFAPALLHAERLTRLLADAAVASTLQAQAARHPERRDVLARYLDRAEPRARHLHDVITTSGERLLRELAARAREREQRSRA